MLGIAKGAGGFQSPPPPPDVKVSITPQSFTSISTNGSYTTPFFTSSVSNGVGPFTYSWKFDSGSVLTPNDAKTRVQASGYNSQVEGVLTLTVTDAGDANKTATSTVNVTIVFEDRIR